MSAKPKQTGKKKQRAVARAAQPASGLPSASDPLLADLRDLILAARRGVALAVDSGLVTLYWQVGRRIRLDILQEKRAEYGEQIVASLGRQLATEFGRGFEQKNLRRMIQFAEVFPDEEIVAALRRLPGRRQRTNGTVSRLAKATRHGTKRRTPAGNHSLRRKERAACRVARTGEERHPRGHRLLPPVRGILTLLRRRSHTTGRYWRVGASPIPLSGINPLFVNWLRLRCSKSSVVKFIDIQAFRRRVRFARPSTRLLPLSRHFMGAND